MNPTSRLNSQPKISERQLQSLQSQLKGELRFDELHRKIYATDASLYQEIPLAVAFPKTTSDIQTLIRFANDHQTGLIPRTAGTSLAGQVVGSGIVVDVSKHFTEIIEINVQERWVRVQPGVIRNELNMVLAQQGLLFGPETSTANRAMIGGMVGNNSCGSNSIVWGSTRDHLLELKGFLSDGSEAHFHALSPIEFAAKCNVAPATLESSIYRLTRELLSDPQTQARIRAEFPKPEIQRRNTGYAIDALIRSAPLAAVAGQAADQSLRPFNFCELIAGSEGTLFFVTEIKLNCVPLPPPASGLLCAHFETVEQSLRATQIAMKHKPFSCELMDHWVLEGAARNIEQRKNAAFVRGNPGAILMIELRGADRAQVLHQVSAVQRSLEQAQLGYHFPVLFDGEAQQAWQLRQAGLGIISNVPGDTKPVAFIEDTAVALEDLPSFIGELNQILHDRYQLRCVHYAHAGAGEIHLRPNLNLKTEVGRKQLREVARDVADLVKKYRGSLSGEHGDGRVRAEFLERMVGSQNFELLRQIKQLWDPNNIFNPGKIIDAPPMNQQLRYQPGPTGLKLETVFDFSQEQGLLRAAELCSGSGDCRKTQLSGGTMCPSYMATRNEKDTTRARANALRQILVQPSDLAEPLNNPQLLEVMDLCLSCKGCKNECPSNVDVAKLKAEFLQHYYDANGVPRRTRMIAGFASSMALAAKVPRLAIWLLTTGWTSSLIKRFSGFASKRTLPKLHASTLQAWFKNHQPHPNAGNKGAVNFFCDEFTNYNDVPIGIAAVELIEALGFEVIIPEHGESGRSAMSKGLLRQARSLADRNVKMLASRVNSDRPLIGVEPSALLSFRDEYPVLVSPEFRSDARRLAENCLLIDEWIDRLIRENQINNSAFTDQSQKIRLHGHCHQKALSSLAATVRMLQLPKNYSVKLIPSGCCGMAGSFGYEAEHYDLSMQIGELVLFPAIRSEADSAIIAAGGTSCRHQIFDGTGRNALHPVQILRQALR
jgi:FAD/FMN-containing dehydrogenase/Fe-S oxidoreductase